MIIALLVIGLFLLGITFVCYSKDCYGAAIIFAFWAGYLISAALWERQQELNAHKNDTAIDTIAVTHKNSVAIDTIAVIHQDIYIHDAGRLKK